ncbi:Centrosomal protein of 170 kDa protein B [Dissostichus eleginoides]|uniref:Centrosomal protein of 170 kDa protein B n=1 Tax=Dissostichus eleginoides TaxID=100907 RepID=A0AAD9ESQ3_DISEL|nr:Centrosomal protein of 170 kDa protein B [Dissostichus eleginoides]
MLAVLAALLLRESSRSQADFPVGLDAGRPPGPRQPVLGLFELDVDKLKRARHDGSEGRRPGGEEDEDLNP